MHYVKDVTLGEDASTVYCGAGADVLSLPRNAVVSLLRRDGHSTVAPRLRHYSRCPTAALALLGLMPG